MTSGKDIRKKLMELKDEGYRDFNSKLIPNVDKNLVIGVRIPALRKLEKELRTEDLEDWLSDLPHKYLEENTLHGIVISNMKSQEDCLLRLEEFLPYIDNWATCDIINPKVLACSACPSIFIFCLLWPYTKSPTSGCPIDAICTLI